VGSPLTDGVIELRVSKSTSQAWRATGGDGYLLKGDMSSLTPDLAGSVSAKPQAPDVI
jgi:hypothetical protein